MEALPAVDKNIIYIYSEKEKRYLPELKKAKKTELRFKAKLLMLENDVKKLIEMIDVMCKAFDNDKQMH